jgi:hypothetical protein
MMQCRVSNRHKHFSSSLKHFSSSHTTHKNNDRRERLVQDVVRLRRCSQDAPPDVRRMMSFRVAMSDPTAQAQPCISPLPPTQNITASSPPAMLSFVCTGFDGSCSSDSVRVTSTLVCGVAGSRPRHEGGDHFLPTSSSVYCRLILLNLST